MTDGLTFSLPTGREELIAAFLSVPNGPQQLMLMAIKLRSSQPNGELAGRMLTMLRTDPRTRQRVGRVERKIMKQGVFRSYLEHGGPAEEKPQP